MFDAYPDTFPFATRAAYVEQARRQGRIASFLGMENGQAIENSLGVLRACFALGVEKLAGGNLLRVLAAAETIAVRLAAQRPPSTATIEALDGRKAP